MRKEFSFAIFISLLCLSFLGCSASVSTGNPDANAKSANTAPSPAADKDGTSAKKSEKTKSALKASEKPEGSAKKAKKGVPIPEDWIYVYDSGKGYGFSVPDGSVGDSASASGVDFMGITTPAPSEIDIFVLAFKDKTLTKDDLLDQAVEFLEALGQTITPGDLQGEGDDYAVADATTVLEDGSKGKLRILVGTDITDNYIMILGTATDKFAANEKIIDEIWGSFEIWSGGASNN